MVMKMKPSSIKTYSELITLPTFIDRFNYLKLNGAIGEETFGFRRKINQDFYHGNDWLSFRDAIIIRDSGCDLAMDGYEIYGPIFIHHLNPITYDDIIHHTSKVLDPENVVCTKHITHNAIHYGDEKQLILGPVSRVPNDTCPWKNLRR